MFLRTYIGFKNWGRGQGSFRFAVEQAYQQCAVTKEHSIPLNVFMKSIMDYSRAQISTNLSEHLKSEYHNGKIYYEMNARKIWLPDNPLNKPSQENLEYHQNHIFLR
jgi:hypothetical protein